MAYPHPPEVRERARALRELGMSYKTIGLQLGIASNTIRRWFDPVAHERDLASARKYKREKAKKGICGDCGGPTNWTRKEPSIRCQQCQWAWRAKQPPKWSEAAIIAAIQRWVKEYGRPPRSHEWRRGGEWWPSYGSVYGPRAPFPTWRRAIQAAGYDTPAHTHKTPGPGGRWWSIEEARRLRDEGLNDVEIGERFDVSNRAIRQALGPKDTRPYKDELKKRTREQRIADLRKALAKQQ